MKILYCGIQSQIGAGPVGWGTYYGDGETKHDVPRINTY